MAEAQKKSTSRFTFTQSPVRKQPPPSSRRSSLSSAVPSPPSTASSCSSSSRFTLTHPPPTVSVPRQKPPQPTLPNTPPAGFISKKAALLNDPPCLKPSITVSPATPHSEPLAFINTAALHGPGAGAEFLLTAVAAPAEQNPYTSTTPTRTTLSCHSPSAPLEVCTKQRPHTLAKSKPVLSADDITTSPAPPAAGPEVAAVAEAAAQLAAVTVHTRGRFTVTKEHSTYWRPRMRIARDSSRFSVVED
ncbi:hypothetical protein HDU89_003113 [Geranomyces variabilis]|nr:hypothetical protein HDU89_003113 [Geranomyces variabilis]